MREREREKERERERERERESMRERERGRDSERVDIISSHSISVNKSHSIHFIIDTLTYITILGC